jgi:TonB family protein
MKEPSLQISATLSLLIHIVFIILSLVVMRRSNYFIKPSEYIVSLVGPEVKSVASSVPETGSEETSEFQTEKMTTAIKEEKEYASDRIESLKAKKKIKEIVRLRRIISLKGSVASKEKTIDAPLPSGDKGDTSFEDLYTARIGGEINQQYVVVPELKGKNLEALISVTILKDGTIKINKIEKSSGNILFDRSVLRAINKASPVTQPPYEMELGLRFTP